MFDLGAAELLVIVIVAVIVIGPKDLPLAMRTAGRWIGKVRKVSAHFRSGLDTMVREAELEDMEKKWQAQNEAIMKRQSGAAAEDAGEPVMTGPPPAKPRNVMPPADANDAVATSAAESSVEASAATPKTNKIKAVGKEPELPLDAGAEPSRSSADSKGQG